MADRDELKPATEYPKEIYLVRTDDLGNEVPDIDDSSWCAESVYRNDIKYVRADIASPQLESNTSGSHVKAMARHPISQVKTWADDLRKEGGNYLIVQMLDSYAALLAQPAAVEPATVPKGWKLVPIEPTSLMLAAISNNQGMRSQWRAAIESAPSPAVAEPARKAIDAQGAVNGVRWDFFPAYLIDNVEGQQVTITEEWIQSEVAAMMKHPDYMGALAASSLPAATVGKEFDVRTILLDVVPGDGSGLEIYAKNVGEVVERLTKISDDHANDVILLQSQIYMLEAKLAQQPAASDVRDAAIKVCDAVDLHLKGGVSSLRPLTDDLRAAVQSAPAVQAPCDHIFHAVAIDGSNSANVPSKAVCKKCGHEPAVQAGEGKS